ncbi:sigma-70 family RNA polymerase sigma factor [Polyangium aurulentum]|uniref:sigma-70 family RNA polymerase sigma factor n=1 Tax=Polyangium aurulentum TaxID=2567896 RepID=UPI0010AE2F5E|nr:sigma-70 family RNA polymerase sigma factor [Polyangium aurulentum]UQA59966.1 sigma-70 family RNA polymerase sigma factor [Polyangium aurulentum]
MKCRDDAVGALFRAQAEAVASVLCHLGVDSAEVEDLTQNVFVVAHRRRAKLPKDAEGARRWLLEAARKHAANWRCLFRHQYEVLGYELVLQAVGEPEDPEAHLALRDVVFRALDQLDEPEREILVLYHLVGESLEKLGALFALTRSGAYARLQTAEERMRGSVRKRARGRRG